MSESLVCNICGNAGHNADDYSEACYRAENSNLQAAERRVRELEAKLKELCDLQKLKNLMRGLQVGQDELDAKDAAIATLTARNQELESALRVIRPFVMDDFYPNCATPEFKDAVNQMDCALAAVEKGKV